MENKKGQKVLCIRDSYVRNGSAPMIKKGDVVIIQGVGSSKAIWFEHSHEQGGNFDPEDFIIYSSYEIY